MTRRSRMSLKPLGWLIGFAAFGVLVVLSVAGVSGAVAVLVTAVAIVGMIALGNLVGGRSTPNRIPYPTPEDSPFEAASRSTDQNDVRDEAVAADEAVGGPQVDAVTGREGNDREEPEST